MHELKIKITKDTCQILEQTSRPISKDGSIYRSVNGMYIYCYDYPDYVPSSCNVYLRGAEHDKDDHIFGVDKQSLAALEDFCKAWEWRFVICI